MISELTARVFQARNFAHIAHLNSESYSQHMALGSFYEDVIEAIDTVVEAYIGQYDEKPKYEGMCDKMPKDMVKFLRNEADWIETNRCKIADDSPAIENLIDSLTEVYLKTVYKLEHLK